MADPPEPNRIHSLPVFVRYHLPSSSQTFTTLFATPQQVYVHPNATSSTRDGEDEAWGSIYLKTVVQGVLMASPELHPGLASSPDLSLYILDPRETFLRKSRATTLPQHLRSSFASSPLPTTPSSPAIPNYSTPPEVWTGKGLASWALDEPGVGKNLITGRLTRSSVFADGSKSIDGLEAMEALMAMNSTVIGKDEGESWGIEISMGLKLGGGTSYGGHGLHSQVSSVIAGNREMARRSSSTVSDVSSSVDRLTQPSSSPVANSQIRVPVTIHPTPPSATVSTQPQPTAGPSHGILPLSPSRIVSITPNTKARETITTSTTATKRHSTVKKKKCTNGSHTHSHPHSHSHSRVAPSTLRKPSPTVSKSVRRTTTSSDAPFPDDIPARLYNNPETLTKEQAERLLESPAFLSMLSRLTGQPIESSESSAHGPTRPKRAREDSQGDKTKRPKSMVAQAPTRKAVPSVVSKVEVNKETTEESPPLFKCWNCGRTKSAVWRMKVMDDGKSVRVCNACGLYWNKMRAMRPPTLWEGVDEDVKAKSKKDGAEPERPASRIDSAHKTPSSSGSGYGGCGGGDGGGGGFKRTLSSVVEQDAKRIASMKLNKAGSSLRHSFKPAPMTSPPRASGSATKGVRNARWNGGAGAGASSPGGWAEPMHPPPQSTDNFNPIPPTPRRVVQPDHTVQESPNTAIRRILGADTTMQSLEMPLSDDGGAAAATKGNQQDSSTSMFDWNTDLSAFFDVEGFSLLAHPTTDILGATTGSAVPKSEEGTEGDDVYSQLFNRTSSAMMESSPTPFDFSQLPPSSPPLMSSHLPHSALLLSSPDLSPMDRRISPTKSKGYTPASTYTPTTEKATPKDQDEKAGHVVPANGAGGAGASAGDLKAFLAGGGFDAAALEELFGRMTDNGEGREMESSAAEAEGIVGGNEDFFALLEKGFEA